MEEFNYFNYFTEIEEHFWRKRGAHLLVSPLDWAIVETWQKSGIPLASVLKGIDRAFESYARSRRASAGRPLKSLAYCVDAVLDAAAEAREAAAGAGPSENGSRAAARPATEAFTRDELRSYLHRNATKLRAASVAAQKANGPQSANADLAARFEEAAARIEALAPMLDSPATLDLEDFERRLTVLEDKLLPAMQTGASDEVLLNVRREMDRQLAPYRRKMSAEQLAQLERQYMQKRLFESFGVPRLSLFYLT
jgi:hypothetical protein